jgi:hypothetical protein
MGLDVTAYAKIDDEPIAMTRDEYCLAVPRVPRVLWIDNEAVFEERLDGLPKGAYRVSGERRDFSMGSYTYYGEWRSKLGRMVGVDVHELWIDSDTAAAKETPFYELLCFSDCEGTLGPKTCAKLARDFEEHEVRAVAFAKRNEDPHWFEQYLKWQTLFALAAHGGVVDFH